MGCDSVSGIVLASHGGGLEVPTEDFALMCRAQAHRATHGAREVQGTCWRLAFQRFCTTPEEVGECQPVHAPDRDLWLALEGRLDNREELLSVLAGRAHPCSSDAELALAAFERWGEEAFRRFVGPFAVVVVDNLNRRVVCARDQLGERTLVYARVGELLLVASEEQALLAHPLVDGRLNERTLARYLAVLAPAEGETFFANIAELPPGHVLIWEGGKAALRRYWQPELSPLETVSQGEAIEQWRHLLRQAVHACSRSTSPVSVLMSGGLDSTSVAALAAQGARGGQPVAAVSWVFDELPGADERRFMAPVVRRHSLEWMPLCGDARWPLCPEVEWGDNPNGPGEAPSKALWFDTAAALRSRDRVVLLTGESGDHLYFGWEYWLHDLLRAGRIGAAAANVVLATVAGLGGDRRELRALRSALGRAARRRRGGERAQPVRPWLTPRALRLIGEEEPGSGTGGPGHRRFVGLLDPWNRWGLIEGYRFGRRLGLDVRRPYRDLRLAVFAARIPSYLLHRRGWSKWIGRVAMQGSLPRTVAWRRWRSSHLPFVARGLAERALPRVWELLTASDSLWPEFVDARAFAAAFPDNLRRGRDGAGTVLAWQCVCLESWRRRGLLAKSAAVQAVGEERKCA